jgi:large subunit GTPase 1
LCLNTFLLSRLKVVDARDPLTYRSEDLERYALDLHPTKRSFLLLNKADLLPEALRSAWADHFDSQGVDYAFWSAKAGMDEHLGGERAQDVCVFWFTLALADGAC